MKKRDRIIRKKISLQLCFLLISSFFIACESRDPCQNDHQKWGLWSQKTTCLRGANIWQKVLRNEDNTTLGPDPIGPPYSQQDFDQLSKLGANFVIISHPGLYTETPPYTLNIQVQENLDQILKRVEKARMFAVIAFRTGPGRNEADFYQNGEEPLRDIWISEEAQNAWVEMWQVAAKRYKDHPIIVGYELMVEPHLDEEVSPSGLDWNQLSIEISRVIREVDTETPILISSMNWGHPSGLAALKISEDSKTVYAVHQYEPHRYTHQIHTGEQTDFVSKNLLKTYLSPIKTFQHSYGQAVAITEFGVKRFAPEADRFLENEMSLFEKLGVNYAFWLWESSYGGINYDDFNLRFGPNPENHREEPNELMKVIQDYFSRNSVRPAP